jgi:hypothetical protein
MSKHYSYHSINQFHNIIRSVKSSATFDGFNEEGQPKYDNTKSLPIIKFTGTVKIHGTNAGIGYNSQTNKLWTQSRSHVLSEKSNNAGFNSYVMDHEEYFRSILSSISKEHIVVLYGEWCGSNIQKNVAISKLTKRFIIFACKIINESDNNIKHIWIPQSILETICSTDHLVWNIFQFKTWEMNIDFSKPNEFIDKLTDITLDVEKECPVGKYFGVSGIGEGVVWSSENGIIFKVKGKEHSSTNSSKIVSEDTEKISSIANFIKYSVTENRLNQGIEQVFTIKNETAEIKNIYKFIKWVINDIHKEEKDTLINNNLLPEDTNKSISDKARVWFTNYLSR